MDAVVRALIIYVFLMIIFRVSGKRSLGQITTFDFVLLLIIGESVQQGLIGEDFSLTKAVLLIVTLVIADIGFSLWKQRWPAIGKFMDGVPVIVVEHGKPIEEHMSRARVDIADILSAARETHGLERIDQIKYAVLERNGGISIIPASSS
jgi:uncharacterized membrane protein YcaP (DUF421 family)